MYKRIIPLCLMLASSWGMWAQSQYDAARLSSSELNGTARYVGMGGAMGALGADITTMSTNPAGTGLFRGNDVSLSFGFNKNMTSSSFNGTQLKDERLKASFDQAGFIYTNKMGNHTTLRYFNFGFNYRKVANFNRQFRSGGQLNGFSMSRQMTDMLIGADFAYAEDMQNIMDADNPYIDSRFNSGNVNPTYLSMMGVRTGLVETGGTADDLYFLNYEGLQGDYFSREEGGINNYDMNVSFNILDRFYVGATLGVYDINYNRYSSYGETVALDGNDNGNFSLGNWFSSEGTGLDFKLGVIFRPLEDSPFRIGLAVHTPVWYDMTDRYTAALNTKLSNMPEDYNENLSDYLQPDYVLDYRFRSPWKVNLSAGTTLSNIMAIGVEYEYAGYSSIGYKDVEGYSWDNVDMMSEKYLQDTHTFKVGVESNLTDNFSVRCGYNYQTSPIKTNSVKYVPNIESQMNNYIWYDETRTDPEYHNLKARNTFTFGLGYRGRIVYADLAYKYDFYKSDFYAFDDYVFSEDGNSIVGRNKGAKVDHERHQLLFTIGAHF